MVVTNSEGLPNPRNALSIVSSSVFSRIKKSNIILNFPSFFQHFMKYCNC